jgi:hypothetical protein
MGKHTGLKNTGIERQIGHEPEEGAESDWNDEVVKKEAEYRAKFQTKEALAAAYSEKRNEKEAFEKKAKVVGVDVEALERLLVRALEADGAQSIGLAGGEKFRLDDKPVTKATDPDAFNKWIMETGRGALLSVHANTRAAIAVERYRNGITETPGLSLKLRTTIHRDKAK